MWSKFVSGTLTSRTKCTTIVQYLPDGLFTTKRFRSTEAITSQGRGHKYTYALCNAECD